MILGAWNLLQGNRGAKKRLPKEPPCNVRQRQVCANASAKVKALCAAAASYFLMMVPVSPRRPAAAFSRLVISARPCGYASTYSRQASTLGSMEPGAN